MIERQLTVTVHRGMEPEFERFVATQYAPAIERFPGASNLRILRELKDRQHYQITSWFDSEETAAGWRTSDEHNRLSPLFKAFFAEFTLNYLDVIPRETI